MGITKCSEKLWLVWPLSASQPLMPIQYSKNVMELMLMITDMQPPHHLMVMVNLLLLMVHQLHLTVNPLHPMENQLLHTVNQLHHMELKKLLCQILHQSSFVSVSSRKKRSAAEDANPMTDVVERVNEIYNSVITSEQCMERIACELGGLASDVGLKESPMAKMADLFVTAKY